MTPEPVADQLAYRPRQAAQVIGLSYAQLNELIAQGRIESFKLGGARLIRREALVDFLDQVERESAPHSARRSAPAGSAAGRGNHTRVAS